MEQHVQKCSEYSATRAECQICGLFPKTVEELHQITIQSQWHHVWLDLVKMPQSILGNNNMYILTLVDLFFTKWPEAAPIRSKKIHKMLLSPFMKFFTVWDSRQSLAATREENAWIHSLMDKFSTILIFVQRISSVYHPKLTV